MVWIIMAALVFTGSDSIDFKLNRDAQFNTEYECVEYINTYDAYIKASLKRVFPNSKVIDIRCVDTDTINKMQEYLNRGEEVSK